MLSPLPLMLLKRKKKGLVVVDDFFTVLIRRYVHFPVYAFGITDSRLVAFEDFVKYVFQSDLIWYASVNFQNYLYWMFHYLHP